MATKQADNRYSQVKYNQTKYGASATSDKLSWGIEVDWDGDGLFDGTNEANRMKQFYSFRGRKNMLQPRGQGFETIQTGTLRVSLDNYDGKYDGWNSSSPLYPNVTYGRDIKIRVKDMSTGTIYPIYYGVVSNIEPVGYGQDTIANISGEDGWRWLRDYSARVSIKTDVPPDTAIGHVLDYISWPERWGRSISTSADSIDYWWASGNKKAASDIEDIANSFVGMFCVDAQGRAKFLTRDDITDSVINLTQSDILKDIYLPQPWEYSRSITRIKVHPRLTASTGTVFQLQGDVPLVQDGTDNARTFWVDYSYNGTPTPAQNVVAPLVPTTDYTMNTQSDGGGVDKTSDCTVSISDFGDTAKIIVANNSGGDVYITKLQVRGDSIYETDTSDIIYNSGSSQPREFNLDLVWQQNTNTAQDFANIIGPFFSSLHPFPVIKIENRPELQFAVDIFDIITLEIDKLGIEAQSFRIGGIEHRSIKNCQSILTTLYLEPYLTNENFWTWPITNFGVDTIFGW